jgi:hypothetical protein
MWSDLKNISKLGECQLCNILSLTKGGDETCADMLTDAKHFIQCYRKRNVCTKLSYFTILCNNDEYKRMGQDLSLGQLYNVQNKIKISTVTGWAYSFISTMIAI